MRQRYLALLTLFASLPAGALTFQTRMENIAWKVEGDQFECRLSQPIEGFGSGTFVRRAGEQPVFQLRSDSNALGAGTASLLAAAAPWQPGRGDINLGNVRMARSGVLFSSSQGQASRLINGLLDGRSTVVRNYTGEAGRPMEVRVLPVSFAKAYNDYQVCAGKLLPMNYDQVRQTQVGFPGRYRAGRSSQGAAGRDPRLHESRPDGEPCRAQWAFRQQWQPPYQPRPVAPSGIGRGRLFQG